MKTRGMVFVVAIMGCSDTSTVGDGALGIDAAPPCPPGYADCDRDPAHTCESNMGSTASCGFCGARCIERPGTLATCDGVRCGSVCRSGHRDCDADPGNGCETDLTTSLDGWCELLPPRPWRPQSVTFTTSHRPTFAWRLPADVSGARIEVCADRACSRVEVAEDVTGESYRPATPLAAGVHYWRLRGWARGRLSADFSATWLFRSPATESTYDTAWSFIPDVDGDGAEDQLSGDDVLLSSTGRRWLPAVWVDGAHSDQRHSITHLQVAGDLDGDGYGDLLGVSNVSLFPQMTSGTYRAAWIRGGPDGPRLPGWTDLPTVEARYQRGQFAELWVVPLGDIDGNGGADVALQSLEGYANSSLLYFAFSGRRGATPAGRVQNSELAALGDIDGDGRSDVLQLRRPQQAAPIDPTPTSRVVIGASPDTFAPLPACGAAPAIMEAQAVSVADDDGDGLADLTLLNAADRPLVRHFGTPAGFRADRCESAP